MIAIFSGIAFFVALAYNNIAIAEIAMFVFCASVSESLFK